MTNAFSALAGRRRSALLFCLLTATIEPVCGQDNKPSGWVVIPVNEYGALRARAFPMEREPEPQPVNATLTRVEYDLRVDGDVAVGRATVTVDVLREGQVQAPIPAGLMVREARIGGRPVSLIRSNGRLAAVLDQRGRSTILLDIALPVSSVTGEEKLVLPSSASGVTRASLSLPRPGLDLVVTGGLLADSSETEGEGRWIAYARANEPLTFAWRRNLERQRAALPLRFRGSLTEIAGLGEDSSSVYAEVGIDVVQGVARQVRVHLPPAITINQVQGAQVADWEVRPGELAVSFLEPVEHTSSFVIHAEARLAREGTIGLPLLWLLDSERETGGAAVEVLGAGEIKSLRSNGLERVEPGELGPAVAARQSPTLAAFRFRPGAPEARTLALEVARYTPQVVATAHIEEARYRMLLSTDGKSLVEARYAVRSTQRSFLRLTLPAGAILWSASIGGKPARPGLAAQGSLLVPLEKVSQGDDSPSLEVELVYLGSAGAWTEKGKLTLTLPALDLSVSRTGLELYYPPGYRVTLDPGAFRQQDSQQPWSAQPSAAEPAPAGPKADPVAATSQTQAAAQSLVDRYRARNEVRRPVVPLALAIAFPAVGPSLHLASELTAENRAAVIELSYHQDRKGGAR